MRNWFAGQQAKNVGEALALALLALLPFHAFFTNYLSYTLGIPGMWLQAWKDIVLVLFFLLAVAHAAAAGVLWRRLSTLDWLLAGIAAFALVHGLVIAVPLFGLDTAVPQWIWGAKYLLEPLLAFVGVRLFAFGLPQLSRWVWVLVSSSVLALLWGLWVRWYANETILIDALGYTRDYTPYAPGVPLPYAQFIEDTEIARTQATFSGPNDYAVFILTLLPLYAFLFWRLQRFLPLLGLGLAFFFSLYSLFTTFSRSGYVALAAMLLFAGFLYLRRRGVSLWVFGGAFAVLIGGILSAKYIFYESLPLFIQKPASTIAHFDKTIEGAQMLLDKPLGLGLGAAGPASWRFSPLIPENMYIGWGLELGFIGLFLILAFYALSYIKLERAIFAKSTPTDVRLFLAAVALAFVGYFTVGMFLHPVDAAPNTFTLSLLLGLATVISTSYVSTPLLPRVSAWAAAAWARASGR